MVRAVQVYQTNHSLLIPKYLPCFYAVRRTQPHQVYQKTDFTVVNMILITYHIVQGVLCPLQLADTTFIVVNMVTWHIAQGVPCPIRLADMTFTVVNMVTWHMVQGVRIVPCPI